MSGGSYRPLGGYSPSLQPSVETGGDITDPEQLSLNDSRSHDYGRPDTEPVEPVYNTEYNHYRYGGGYGDPNDDVEQAEGLVKNEFQQPVVYKLYKRRWIGLAVLTLHSFAIGWGFTAPSVVADTAIEWYKITFEELNDLSVAGNLIFLVPAPFVIWVLNRAGPKWSMIISIVFTVIGNWVIYAGASTHNFNINIAGTVIHSISAPFSLCAPTRYSRMWFGDNARTFATALPTLAYLMGDGFGAVTGPLMVKPKGPLQYDQQALIIAILFSAIALPAFFIPNKPPTPPSAVASQQGQLSAWGAIKSLLTNNLFYLQLFTFSILAGGIEAFTNVMQQAIQPYGFSQQQGGNALAILVFVGIAAALVVSPILDKTKKYELVILSFSIIIAASFTALPWIPGTHSIAALYAVCAVIGAFSISLEPAVLEYQASSIHPVSPEYASVMTLCGAKVSVAILVTLVGKVLVIKTKKGAEGQPDQSLFNGLLLLAGLSWVVVVMSSFNGRWIFKRRADSLVKGNS